MDEFGCVGSAALNGMEERVRFGRRATRRASSWLYTDKLGWVQMCLLQTISVLRIYCTFIGIWLLKRSHAKS